VLRGQRNDPPTVINLLLSRHQNARQNHYIEIGNRCFENVTQIFGNEDQNLIPEEI
jgi:hypothetical protein